MILFEVREVGLAISDHAEESAAGMIVLLVFLEMIAQFDDPLGEKRDLDLRRAGVLGVDGRFLDDLGLLSCS